MNHYSLFKEENHPHDPPHPLNIVHQHMTQCNGSRLESRGKLPSWSAVIGTCTCTQRKCRLVLIVNEQVSQDQHNCVYSSNFTRMRFCWESIREYCVSNHKKLSLFFSCEHSRRCFTHADWRLDYSKEKTPRSVPLRRLIETPHSVLTRAQTAAFTFAMFSWQSVASESSET